MSADPFAAEPDRTIARLRQLGSPTSPVGDDRTWTAACPRCQGSLTLVSDGGDRAAVTCWGGCDREELDALLFPLEPTPGRAVRLLDAATIAPRRTRWAWRGRLPLGAVTLLCGHAGLGKSTVTNRLAAELSRGALPGDLEGEPSRVLMATAEDALASTAVPRLMAAGADLQRVSFLRVAEDGAEDVLSFPEDTLAISERARETGARLVVVDPLAAFLTGKLDSHRDAAVRRALAPLAQLAEELELAVLCVLHWNKSAGGELLARVGGSVGFVAAARSVLAFAADADQGEDGPARVLVQVKSNLGPKAPALGYRIEGREVRAGEETFTAPLAVEVGESDASAGDLLEGAEERSAMAEAREFLLEVLADGPLSAREVKDQAEAAGVSARTLERAKAKLGVRSERPGGSGAWRWRLPEGKAATVSSVGNVGGLGHLGDLAPSPTELGRQDRQGCQDRQGPNGDDLATWSPEKADAFIEWVKAQEPDARELREDEGWRP